MSKVVYCLLQKDIVHGIYSTVNKMSLALDSLIKESPNEVFHYHEYELNSREATCWNWAYIPVESFIDKEDGVDLYTLPRKEFFGQNLLSTAWSTVPIFCKAKEIMSEKSLIKVTAYKIKNHFYDLVGNKQEGLSFYLKLINDNLGLSKHPPFDTPEYWWWVIDCWGNENWHKFF